MKLRWLAIAMAIPTFTGGLWTLAQVQDQDKDQLKSGDVQNAPAQAPATLPAQDDSQIKHDGTRKISMRWETAMSAAGAASATGIRWKARWRKAGSTRSRSSRKSSW